MNKSRYVLIVILFAAISQAYSSASEREIILEVREKKFDSPGVEPGFSELIKFEDQRSLFEQLDLSIFEFLGSNLMITHIMSHMDPRALQALSCTSKKGQKLVNTFIDRIRKKVGFGFEDPIVIPLSWNELRVANTYHMPVMLWTWFTYMSEEGMRTFDGSYNPEELELPLTNLLSYLGTRRLNQDGKPLSLEAKRNTDGHTVRLAGGLLEKVKLVNQLSFHAITDPPIDFEVPCMIGQLQMLRSMLIRNCAVLTLPPEFATLANLRELYLSNNNLRELPGAVLNLGNLAKLSLAQNRLEALPKDMRGLAKLEDLNLDGNPMEELPPGILTLHSLEYLHIGQTKISYLPLALCHMPKLCTIFMYHEPTNLFNRPTPTFWQNTIRIYSEIFRPFILIPEAWDIEKVSVMVGQDFVLVRDTVQETTQGLIFRTLLFAMVPVALPIGWLFFKPRDN